MSDFTPGFVARHDAAAAALVQAFPLPDFVARDLRDVVAMASSAGAAPSGPKHFSPADPAARPTQGWDPLDASAPATPFIDPLEAAHAAGYAEGLAAAAAAAQESADRDHALVAGIAGELAAGHGIDRDRIATQLRATVMALVAKLVDEVGVSADILTARVEAAADMLADAAEAALLRVHPDDVALLDGRLPKSIFAAGDAGIARGSFVLESASTLIEDGPDMWLEQLAQAMDKVAVPVGSC